MTTITIIIIIIITGHAHIHYIAWHHGTSHPAPSHQTQHIMGKYHKYHACRYICMWTCRYTTCTINTSHGYINTFNHDISIITLHHYISLPDIALHCVSKTTCTTLHHTTLHDMTLQRVTYIYLPVHPTIHPSIHLSTYISLYLYIYIYLFI